MVNINQLIEIVKTKLNKNIACDKIEIEDKTFLHKNHKTHEKKKFHIKIIIQEIWPFFISHSTKSNRVLTN